MNYKANEKIMDALRSLAVADDILESQDWPEEYSELILRILGSINTARASLANIMAVDGANKALTIQTLVESKQNA